MEPQPHQIYDPILNNRIMPNDRMTPMMPPIKTLDMHGHPMMRASIPQHVDMNPMIQHHPPINYRRARDVAPDPMEDPEFYREGSQKVTGCDSCGKKKMAVRFVNGQSLCTKCRKSKRKCGNCGTSDTPVWRPLRGVDLCNACRMLILFIIFLPDINLFCRSTH